MKTAKHIFVAICFLFCAAEIFLAQAPRPTPLAFGMHRLADVRMRDVCILVDEKTKTYYAISSGFAPNKEGFRNSAVRA